MGHGILLLGQKTIFQLVPEHPQKNCASEDVLINGALEKLHKVWSESINEELIRAVVKAMAMVHKAMGVQVLPVWVSIGGEGYYNYLKNLRQIIV